ncbi:HD domain-containing protein [Pasteurella multocida]|uniref:HD domain-containing protein n=1 Tax=Pasteurella multocida TaxID=747 RepID=UPI003CFADC3A
MLSRKAEEYAKSIHSHQLDKAGKPYIEHLAFVADFVANQSDDVIATAWLHDSVEDTETSLEDITRLFGDVIAEAVNAITKQQGENYQDYLVRVKSNEIARKVKVADLTHNMDLSRLLCITEQDRKRVEKYQMALEFLRLPVISE